MENPRRSRMRSELTALCMVLLMLWPVPATIIASIWLPLWAVLIPNAMLCFGDAVLFRWAKRREEDLRGRFGPTIYITTGSGFYMAWKVWRKP
jgi:hypothetical protein